MKRIITLIIAFSICFSMCAFGEGATAVEKQFADELGFIVKAGVPDSQFLTKDVLTRGEFTSLVINMLYPENVFDGEYDMDMLFADVEETHEFYPEIKAASGLGIVKGSSTASFKPEDPILYTDAITVLVNALGYGYLANANGGYPTGYLVAARNIELSKGLKDVQGALSGDIAAKLIYNALFVDSTDFSSVDMEGNIGITVRPDENLLSRTYNIYKYDAKVVATPLSALEGDASSVDTVVLKLKDDSKFIAWTADSGIENELGKKLTVYVKRNPDNGKDEVVFYRDYKSMNVDTINGDKIISITGSYIEYEASYGKFEKISIDGYPDILYNGVLLVRYNNETLKPENGFVNLIDADGNGKAETISVVSFNYSGMVNEIPANSNPAHNIVVDSVNTEKMYITCKWNPRNNLDINEDEFIYTINSKDGSINELSDIKNGDIVSVAVAPEKIEGKTVYFLYVERTKVKDIYNSVNPDENIIDINGEEYKVSSSLYSVKSGYYNNMVNGNDISVYLDYVGKIAYIEDIKKVTNNYAYLISAAVRTTGGDDTLVVKVLEYTNTVNTYNVSLKAKIDGNSYENANEQYAALSTRPANYDKWKDSNNIPYETSISRPVILKFNVDKEITSINTDNPDYLTIPEKIDMGISNPGDEKNIYKDYNSIGYSNEEVMDSKTLKAGFRAPRVGAFRAKASTVEGRFYVNSETYVFQVPDIDTCGLNDFSAYASNPAYSYLAPSYDIIKLFEDEKENSNYKVILTSALEDEMMYDIQAYNVDPDTGVAEMVVLRGKLGINGTDEAEGKAVFLKTSTYYDAASEKEITKIYYTIDGVKELSVVVDTDSLLLPIDYIINGRSASSEDNIYKVDIPALKKGDIIKVTQNGGYLTTLQRVVILDELETETLSSFSYGRRAIGYQASDANRRLFDVNKTNFGGNASTFNHFLVIPEKIKGSLVHYIMGGTVDKKYFISDIDYNDPSTYASGLIDFKGMAPTLITVVKDNLGNTTDVRVEAGDFNDIVSIEEAGSLDAASRIIFRHTDFLVYDMIIINYEIKE